MASHATSLSVMPMWLGPSWVRGNGLQTEKISVASPEVDIENIQRVRTKCATKLEGKARKAMKRKLRAARYEKHLKESIMMSLFGPS